MKKASLIVFLLFFIYPLPAISARNIIISSDKNKISNSEEMMITASTSGFLDSEKIFIKGAFYKESSSNYFGYTKNSNSWIKNSKTASSQKEVEVGSWNKLIVVKADFEDSGFKGSGDYSFKIGYYYINSKGNLSSVNWSSNNVPISIVFTPTSIPIKITEQKNESNISYDYEEDKEVELNGDEKKLNSNTSKVDEDFDKILSNPKQASEYAKIKPITVKENDEAVAVLGANSKNSSYIKILALMGVIFMFISITYIIRRELREREYF